MTASAVAAVGSVTPLIVAERCMRALGNDARSMQTNGDEDEAHVRMMRRMSGWADRPTMKEPEMRRQFEEMRRQMDEMSKSPSMRNPGRSK